MQCTQTEWLSDEDYVRQLSRRIAELRVPLSGSIDLTSRCNLRCVHCYVPPAGQGGEELSTERLLHLLDETAEAGCLYLLLTGGEPLLRDDFVDVYRHAKTKGMIVTVFTNGTLVTDEHLDAFSDLPPHNIEISLYGATAPTYERITGVPGSFAQCMAGIRALLDRGLNVRVKTILMTLNRDEFFDIERVARELGVDFRFDAALFPRLDGDRAPLRLRVPPQEAVEKELADPERAARWRRYYEKRARTTARSGLYLCGAGMTTFHVDARGNLKPCIMTQVPSYNIRDRAFGEGWPVMAQVREREPGPEYPCNGCEKKVLCGYCPAFFGLENGAEDAPSAYLCAMGQCRFDAITRAEAEAQPVGGRSAL